jgi:hypothetical protein
LMSEPYGWRDPAEVFKNRAAGAYKMADAMLRAREAK